MYRIALNFEDGVTHFIECRPGEKVLDAALRQKLRLPMDCLNGVCGACKSYCEDGDYALGEEYFETALSHQEAQERLVLTCQMVPSSDCVIAVRSPSGACNLTPASHDGVIAAVERVGDSTIILKLALEQPDALAFLPGQYVNLVVPGTNRHRAYSFTSKPGAAQVSFLIRNVPGGLMSDWLTKQARVGEPMRFFGPHGTFFLRAVARPVLMLAGGTGLAPLLSMLEVLADQETDQNVQLIYGVTADEDLVETEHLEALAARLPSFSWKSCVADPRSTHPLRGFVTHHLTDKHLNGGNCDVYLCGPPPMVEAVSLFLREKRLEPTHLHYEKFSNTS
jgi:benzoate/toluate 1,2-dioxygenase reductase component